MLKISPTVDVLIALHRNDLYLFNAIKSIKESHGVDVQVILIDDRLNDNSELPFQESCKIVKTVGGVGFEQAINLGSSEVKADYVAILGSDDISSPHRLKNQIKKLEKTQSDISICKVRKFIDDKSLPNLSGSILKQQYTYKVLYLAPVGADGTWVARSNWWKKNILFNEVDTDWSLALRSFGNIKICYSDEVYVGYRMHDLQITRDVQESKRIYQIAFNQWLLECSKQGLPIMDFKNFLILNCATGFKAAKIDIELIELWINEFWNLLILEEKAFLRQIIGRRLLRISIAQRRLFKTPRLNVLILGVLPLLSVDILKVVSLKIRRYKVEIRPRVRLDP